MIEKKIIKDRIVNVVLVSVIQQGVTEQKALEYLDELSFLAETAGCKTVKTFIQKLKSPDSKTFVGKGKLQEIKEYANRKNVDLIIFDDELTGSQISNIEAETKIFTLDRSDLILDIFAA
ncbi:MAG: GTPase HflX, partial [Ginsengibacter sp.]